MLISKNFLEYLFWALGLLPLIFSSNLNASEEDWDLKFGFGPSFIALETERPKVSKNAGLASHSHVGRHFGQWEITMSSFIVLGKFFPVELHAYNSQISGKASLRSVSIGPTLKYFFPHEIAPKHSPYITAGAMLALNTIRLQNPTILGGQFHPGHKLTYNGRGFVLGTGIEKKSRKFNHPLYYEVSYQYLEGYKTSVVGGTTTAVETIHKEITPKEIQVHSILFIIGLTIF